MRKHVIPFIKRKLNTTEEISAKLDDYQIKKIDGMFLPNEVNKRINERIKKEVF